MADIPPELVQASRDAFSAFKTGKPIEAERLCRQIIATKPDFFEGLHFHAEVLSSLGQHHEALASLDRALALRPDSAEAHNNRGTVLHQLNRFDEAVASYDRALALRPDYPEALNNRGTALQLLKRFNEALASYGRALQVRPIYPEALNNSGNTLKELKQYDDALACYDLALKLRPDFAEAINNRGAVLKELKRYDEALAGLDQALALLPNDTEVLNNRGTALRGLGRHDEALASYDLALAAHPGNAKALTNRGHALQQFKRFGEAIACYERALRTQPDLYEALYSEAMVRLLTGDYDRAWEQHEIRLECEPLLTLKRLRNFTQPQWRDQDVSGKTVLIHAEQGFGDTIHFCRYVPLLAGRGARVVFEVQPTLRDLMGTLPCDARIVCRGEPLPDFDLHCPLPSVPLAFRTRVETIPSATPYLRASPQAAAQWAHRLGPSGRPRIGLVWSGNPTHDNDHNRSMALRAMLPLLDVRATFVSVQKEVRAGDAAALKERGDLLHFGDALNDFSDTAALVANLDLLISVDTSVMHLAGAMAKPVWVLLPYIPDWRWLLDRDDSPWYPTARLFRQDESRAWDSVIARVRMALGDFVQSRS